MLTLVRRLIRAAASWSGAVELLDADPGVVAFPRGAHVVLINTTAEPRPVARHARGACRDPAGALRDGTLAAHAGVLATAP